MNSSIFIRRRNNPKIIKNENLDSLYLSFKEKNKQIQYEQ